MSIGGSTKPGRRRAAPPSLVRTPSRARPRRDRGKGFVANTLGILGVLGILALFALWVLGGITWGEALWKEFAQDWPGGGYGFGATAGALLACVLAVLGVCAAGINWKTGKVRSLIRGAVALGCAGAALTISFVAIASIPPKKRSRRAEHWVHSHYPYVWVVGLLATLATAALLLWLYEIHRRGRKSDVLSDLSSPEP
ncbi:hypothetical protein [Streptomyces sp. NPDC002889]|uniref:hypothetical protein n=1 Tax=Streptomyces sp. NPDC002889 TaxID=3364669 RepID=UPI003699A7EF